MEAKKILQDLNLGAGIPQILSQKQENAPMFFPIQKQRDDINFLYLVWREYR